MICCFFSQLNSCMSHIYTHTKLKLFLTFAKITNDKLHSDVIGGILVHNDMWNIFRRFIHINWALNVSKYCFKSLLLPKTSSTAKYILWNCDKHFVLKFCRSSELFYLVGDFLNLQNNKKKSNWNSTQFELKMLLWTTRKRTLNEIDTFHLIQ